MSTEPLTQGQVRTLEALDLICSTTVAGTLFGLTFTLYCLCAWSLYRQIKDSGQLSQRKRNVFTLGYMTAVMLCGFTLLFLNSFLARIVYIDHADYPGGPFNFEASAQSIQPLFASGQSVILLLDLLTLATQIWRLWVVWSGSRFLLLVVTPPTLSLLAFIGIHIANIVHSYQPRAHSDVVAAAVRSLWRGLFSAELAFDLMSSMFVTIFVIGRILMVRRRHILVMGKSDVANQYMGVVTMLVESFALDSAFILAAVVATALNGGPSGSAMAALFLTGIEPFIRIIAYLLVIYRVTTGRAWGRRTEQQLSSIVWDHETKPEGIMVETQAFSTRSGVSKV